MKYFLLSIITFCFSLNLKAAEHVYFIRLNIDNERIELGEFSKTINKKVTTGFKLDDSFDTSLNILQTFFQSNTPASESPDILFFLHAMWGSNNQFVRSQVLDFKGSYIDAADSPIQTVFYVLWDTRPPTYYGNKKNAQASSALLNRLIELLDTMNTAHQYHYNMMCHSMGNKVFFEMLENTAIDHEIFDHIVFAAADVSDDELYNVHVVQNLENIAGNSFVLYNKYDNILILSKVRNGYTPLGLWPDQSISADHPEIQFIDCSFLTDNNKFPSNITGHLYYSTSITTKRKIKELLNS